VIARWRGASVEVRRRRLSLYGPVTVMHAARGGGPVLRGEASWRTASGVLLSNRRLKLVVTIMVRRDCHS
jgi:hypothetical protein